MLLYHISQKENKFTECHLQAEDLSKQSNQGSRQEGWQLGSEEETKFTYNSKGVF